MSNWDDDLDFEDAEFPQDDDDRWRSYSYHYDDLFPFDPLEWYGIEPSAHGDPERSFVYVPAKMDILSGKFSWLKTQVSAALIGSEYKPSKDHSSLADDVSLDAVLAVSKIENKKLVVREVLDDAGEIVDMSVWCTADNLVFSYGSDDLDAGYVILLYDENKPLVCIPFRKATVIDHSVVVVWDEQGIFSL